MYELSGTQITSAAREAATGEWGMAAGKQCGRSAFPHTSLGNVNPRAGGCEAGTALEERDPDARSGLGGALAQWFSPACPDAAERLPLPAQVFPFLTLCDATSGASLEGSNRVWLLA